MKKYLSFLLLILMAFLLVFLPACSGEKEEEDVSKQDTSSREEIKEELFSHLPNKTFNGKELTVLVEGDYMNLYKSAEMLSQEDSPELINIAISNRNNLVSDRFDVTFTEIRTESFGQILDLVRNNHIGGTNLYDIVMPYIPQGATLAFEGYFHLLNESEHIRMEKPYWDQGAREGLSIGFKTYFLTGDFSMLSLACTHALVFNKDVVEDHNLESPYDLVKSGKWTIDKLQEMARKVTADTDGVTGMSYADTYGYLANTNIVTSMFIGSGERLTRKDTNDLPYISVSSERGVNVYGRIFDLINDKQATGHIESFQSDVESVGKTVWKAATEAVAEKRVLFRAMAIADVPELGEYECNFGILPLPKYDEAQDNYHSFVSTVYATSIAIPLSNNEFEDTAIIVEALCQASTDTVKVNYYDIMLKNRKIQDNESEEMLDLIFANRVYDIGAVFTWGGESIYDQNGIGTFMNQITFDGSNTFISKFEAVKDKIQSDLDEAIEHFS